jgi:glycosyltransferase involved in cell wall biosynthesis
MTHRGLLLSAYDADSHRHWRQCLCAGLDDWQWQVLSLPPRHFNWRVRGNPLQWFVAERERLEADYDLLLVTSMVDLATLRGLVPALASLPSLVYFHENQFAYPPGRGQHGVLEAQMVSIYSAMAADQLLFNSRYNLDSFLAGVAALLKRLPDKLPTSIVDELGAKAQVLPVPVEPASVSALELDSTRLQVVWNHRWEYDKGVGGLLEITESLVAQALPFTLHVVGRQFRERPAEFDRLESCLGEAGALGHWGYLEDRSEYMALLAACDVVVSTALHDFQGLSVLEACAMDCTPLVPDRLVYPEWFDADFRYADSEQAVQRLAQLWRQKSRREALPKVEVSSFYPGQLLPRYAGVLRSQLGSKPVS